MWPFCDGVNTAGSCRDMTSFAFVFRKDCSSHWNDGEKFATFCLPWKDRDTLAIHKSLKKAFESEEIPWLVVTKTFRG